MINGEEMLELILRRQSDRKYSSRPIEEEKLERILEAGRMSPSACNAQPWRFVVVTDKGLIEKLSDASSSIVIDINRFVRTAPVLLVIVREKPNFSSRAGGAIKRKDYSHNDIGIATGNICLQAAAEGIGSCIIGWFDEKLVKKILGVPSAKRVELIITLGYSLSDHRIKKRKSREETVSFNKY